MNGTQRFRHRLRWALDVGHKGPTAADLDAQIYAQEWVSKLSGTITRFDVLALEEINAVELGAVRLASLGADANDFELVKNHPRAETSGERLHAALLVEHVDEWTERQEQYARANREPSDDQLANAPGVEGGIAYDGDWNQR